MSSINDIVLEKEKYIYLTTNGRKTGKAHTVQLWFAIANGRIYLSHEGVYTDWIRNIIKDKHVEFKIDGVFFKGKAQIVTDRDTFNIGKYVLYLKYYGEASENIIDDWFSESTIVEIIEYN